MTEIEERSGVEVVMEREQVVLRSVYTGEVVIVIPWKLSDDSDAYAEDAEMAKLQAEHIQELMSDATYG